MDGGFNTVVPVKNIKFDFAKARYKNKASIKLLKLETLLKRIEVFMFDGSISIIGRTSCFDL